MPKIQYKMAAREDENTVKLCNPTFGATTWRMSIAKQKAICETCEKPIPPRTQVWTPATFGRNRLHRLCTSCVREAETALKASQVQQGDWANQPWAQKWKESV